MKKTNCLLTLSVAALCAAGRAYAVGTAPAILSNYGEIQSVKNYSSNPFWNKNSPYNQNFPKPIYATGADLNTGDCNRVVENLVTAYCAEHNYCRNLRISDVRPTIMVQLSQLPGHNFATSCGGYIDSTFDKFQKEYGNTSTVNLPNTATQNTNIEIANPFAPKQTAAQAAIADRTAELERLQSITTPAAGVHAEYFPKTTADLSFTDRLANTAAGYEPYKDKPSYRTPNFLGEDEAFFERLKNQNFEKYCERRPNDNACKPLREHNIYYVTFGSSTKCTPIKYETGKGATISCVPQRANSTFLGWCLDYDTATTYDGTSCPPQHTIAKTDTDDKTYYAKWKCNKPEYEQTQTACIDPAASVVDPGGSGGGDDGSTCPEPSYMDANCECTIVPESHKENDKCVCNNPLFAISDGCCPAKAQRNSSGQCECAVPGSALNIYGNACLCNNGADINDNCGSGRANCLNKMAQDTTLTQTLQSKLSSAAQIDVTELKNRGAYTDIAEAVYKFCVDSTTATPTDFSEFNTWIDSNPTLPIPIPFNGGKVTVDIDAEDLFNYVNYKYDVLLVQKNTSFTPQKTVKASEILMIPEKKSCVPYYQLAGGGVVSTLSTPAVRQAAESIYGTGIYNINYSNSWSFPGKLLKGTFGNPPNPTRTNNYITARKKVKVFANNLKGMSDCSAMNVVVFLIKDKTLSLNGSKVDEVIIKSEPFIIP